MLPLTKITHFDKLHSGCGCNLLAYDHSNYYGRSLLVKQQNANFGNDYFNDRVESAIIQGNCQWLLYRDHLFLGRSHLLNPGYYPSAVNWGGSGNHITSARALPPAGINTYNTYTCNSLMNITEETLCQCTVE